MPENKKKTVVEFAGGIKDLVIKVGGKIIYSGERESKRKTEASEKEEKGLAEMAMVSKFASCVNSVPALNYIWKNARFKKTNRKSFHLNSEEVRNSGKANAYNKIVSANRRGKSIGLRPDIRNRIVPDSGKTLAKCKQVLKSEGISQRNYYHGNDMAASYAKRKMTFVAIVCPFDPKKRSKTKFEMISKWYDIKEFTIKEHDKFHFPFDDADIEVIRKYRNCIVYIVFVEESHGGKKTKWYEFGSEEFSLSGFPEKEIVFRDDTPDPPATKGIL
jgi:hypothetical protein